jgi:peptidyl-prolyl cis-trans isomerase C
MSMIRTSISTLALAVLSCLLLGGCKPAAPTGATPSTQTDAVALLDGEPLSRALLDEIARQYAGSANPYDAPPAAGAASAASAASAPDVSRQRLLDELVDIELLARKARERGVDKQPAFMAETELQAKTLLAQAMVREQIAGLEVTDAELAAAYEQRVPPHQFKLAHILVAEQATAQAVIEQLKQGRPFAELAKRYSIDTDNRHQGGSLGSMLMDQLPTEMAAAVRHLKPGQHAAQPVQTPQGWHVLQLQGLEPLAQRPTLETARAWLHPQILHAKVEAQQKQWRRDAKVLLAPSP